VETADDDSGPDGSDAALGRLSEGQILKAQAVLQELRSALNLHGGKKATLLADLTNSFYSLIPTITGRQKPPPLDNEQIVIEKEGLFEFWLCMGFDELGDEKVGSPIEGVHDLPCPKTLVSAAAGIADSAAIKSACDRGRVLQSQGAGCPTTTMGPELYAAVLLYTGNSIYREINRCLRSDWKSARKYWKYLRMYFEAMNCMPKQQVKLWRGIAVDLYEEYEVGKVITWWSISSCTADKGVAQNFMNQLAGGKATLLTLNCKNACDISTLSFYPHEAESLLPPGTKLRVLSRTRKQNVAEIEVQEV